MAEKGKSLEDFACYIFSGVPGITITQRNTMNAFNSEEIDIALWNTKHRDGFYFLDFVVFIECKNWSSPVGSSEVSWFSEKLRSRGLDFGILVAMNGITGDPKVINEADSIVARTRRTSAHHRARS